MKAAPNVFKGDNCFLHGIGLHTMRAAYVGVPESEWLLPGRDQYVLSTGASVIPTDVLNELAPSDLSQV